MRYVFRGMLTNREMAGELGIDPRTLRSWAKRGHVPSRVNPANNYRLYDAEAVIRALCHVRRTPETS